MRYKFLLFFIFVVVWNILFSSSFSIILTPDGLRISTFSPLLFSFSGDSLKLGYGWGREYDVFKETMLKLGPFKKKVKVKLSHVEIIAGGGVDLVNENIWLLFGLKQKFFTPASGEQKLVFFVSEGDPLLLSDTILRMPFGRISFGYKGLNITMSGHTYFDTMAYFNYYSHILRTRFFSEGFYIAYRLAEEDRLGEYGFFFGAGYMEGPSLFAEFDHFEKIRFSVMLAFSLETQEFYPVLVLEDRRDARVFLRMHGNGVLLYIDFSK